MSKKKKKIFKNKFHNNGVQSLKEEIVNINKNIRNDEMKAYELKSNKIKLLEDLAEIFILNSDAQKILNEYCNNEMQLREIETTNNNRKKDLEYKKNKLTEEELKSINDEFTFKKIGQTDYPVGLFNRPCYDGVAICNQKNVFLSYKDVKNKRCLSHKDRKPCKHLVWLKNDETPLQLNKKSEENTKI